MPQVRHCLDHNTLVIANIFSIVAGNDYTAIIQREITFEPGQSLINISIPITVDDSSEPEETFTVTIDPNPGIIPPADNPVVTVIDTAGKDHL